MSKMAKKEVEFTPLNTTSITPKRASLIRKQLYQINARNYKGLNVIKNMIIAALLALAMQLMVELSVGTWYEVMAYYIAAEIIFAYPMTLLDGFVNYMRGGSYE